MRINDYGGAVIDYQRLSTMSAEICNRAYGVEAVRRGLLLVVWQPRGVLRGACISTISPQEVKNNALTDTNDQGVLFLTA